VKKDSYLLELPRYVVLNPLRASMVKEIGDWRWSSYPAMIGVEPAPIWLQTDWLLGQFDPQRKQEQKSTGYDDSIDFKLSLSCSRLWQQSLAARLLVVGLSNACCSAVLVYG
jgi:hypothetical protein